MKLLKLLQSEFDLVMVHCVACSKDGRRTGHGAGYYDRFLSVSDLTRLRLCFEKLLTDIPLEHRYCIWMGLTEGRYLWDAMARLSSR